MSSFEQIWKLYSKTVIISHTNLFKNAILGSTQLLATHSAYDWHLHARGPRSDTEKNLPFATIVSFVFLV